MKEYTAEAMKSWPNWFKERHDKQMFSRNFPAEAERCWTYRKEAPKVGF